MWALICSEPSENTMVKLFLLRFSNQHPVNSISFVYRIRSPIYKKYRLPQPLQLEPMWKVPAHVRRIQSAANWVLHYCSITEINYAENSHFPHFCYQKAWGVTYQTDERNTGVLRCWNTRMCACCCQSCPHFVGCTQMSTEKKERNKVSCCPGYLRMRISEKLQGLVYCSLDSLIG